MDEDQILQSIIADPSITDPSIDTSELRTTTDTRAELLANVPEFSGLKFDPTQRSYIEDLYSVYGGGLPTLATDTAQIPGAVDTLVGTGGGGGMDQVTGGLDTPTDGLTQSGTFGGQPTFTTTPGTTVDDVTGDITNPDGSYGGNIVDEGALTGIEPQTGFLPSGAAGGASLADLDLNNIDLGNPTGDSRIVSEEQGLVGTPIDPIMDLNLMKIRQQQNIEGLTAPQQNLVSQAFSKVGSTANDIMRDLSEIPGAVADFVGKTVDIAGQKIDVGGTLLRAGINKLAGGPISIVFDVLSEIIPKQDPANTLKRSIVDELKASGKDYGFNIQSGNLNQDPFGRNPISLLGNYEQTLLNDINNPSGTKLGNAKKEFALDYFNTKAEKTAPQENIEATDSLEQLQAEKNAEIAAQNELAKLTGNINLDNFDVTNEAAVDVGTPSFEGFDSGGFDPAPAPVSTIPSAPPSQGFGNPNRNGGDGRGGGGGGSPGSAGPGGSDEMGSF